jgi:uncharacterized protein (DUF3820 family)
MPFGKYGPRFCPPDGEELENLPTHYLRWLCENLDGKGDAELVQEAENQLAMREGQGVERGRQR